MSLSSKLRNFKRSWRKKHGRVNICADLEDGQLISIARFMPRDYDSMKSFLSADQFNDFGDELLAITRTHTSRDQTKFEECLLEMGAFVRGGLPGMELLDRVYPRILKHFGVMDDMEDVLEALKLYVNPKLNKIKRKWVKDDEENEQEQQHHVGSKKMRLGQD